MKKASITDLYEVRLLGLISNIDKDVLIDFYQPLVGASSIGLFLTLLNDPSNKDNCISSFEILSFRTGLTLGELYSSFEALESVGLVKTFYKEDNKISSFIFMLYNPLSPVEFLNDVLLIGTFRKQIGDKEIERLVKKYSVKETKTDYEDVTSSFSSYFSPDFSSNKFYSSKSYKAKGREISTVKTDFDIVLMIRNLSDLSINEKDFSVKELTFIEKLATLYNMDESQMSSLVSITFDTSKDIGKRLDLVKLEKNCRKTFGSTYRREKASPSVPSDISNTDSQNSKLIKLMDTVSPAEFLSIKQNNTKPASSDLKIVEDLALDLGLPYPVINALVDYVLRVNNNMLSKAYIEKIGAALSREGVKTSLDTLDYFYKINNSYKDKQNFKKNKESQKIIEEKESEEYTDEEVDALLDSLEKK